MLRDAGVRTKLLAVLAIPTALLVVVTTLFVGGQVGAARRAGHVNALTDVAIQVNRVVHSLQEERSATLGYLQDPAAGNRARMLGQRQFTNQQLRILRGLVAESPVRAMSDAVQAAVARSASGHVELLAARKSVDAGRFYATETEVFYAKIIRTDLELPGVLSSSGTAELAERLQAYGAISSAIEYAAYERDITELALLKGTFTEAAFAQAAALVAQQRQAQLDFQRHAPSAAYLELDNALAEAENAALDEVRRDRTELLKGRDPDYGASVLWVGAANSRISPMTQAEAALVADIAAVAGATQDEQEQRATVLVVAALLGLGLALMLAVGLARRITRPLRRLTVSAGEIGNELPRMVERMQTPGEGPGVTVEPIPVESSDEVGRLAEAFNTVNEVTVQVAKEQAALRASIAEMFVNVARRNQVLLGRQLSQLDQMEAREEDPDVLDSLFKLDHLATRMRRNAESLLVLAGIDSTRRLRRAMPLSDVIRTAVGEIEAFDRIDLSMSEDPDVSGRHALTVAHLLAELLENATHFSNPDTRVVVAASVTGHGVDITVTDYGLGMTEAEIADANEKIAHPPVAEIAVSQRLGHFVVGRLAARLGASAVLRRGRAAGTVVAVSLPAGVFEGMTVAAPVEVEVVAPEVEEPTPAPGDDVLEVVASQVEDEPAPADEVLETPQRGRRGRLPWRKPKASDPVAEAPVAAPVETEPEAEVVEPEIAPEPVAEVVEPEPEFVPEPVAEVVQPEPEPEFVPEPVAEVVAPAPAAAAPSFVFAAAVDILPGRPLGSGRLGHRPSPLPQPVPQTPPAAATAVPVPTPAEPVRADLADELFTPPALPEGPPAEAAAVPVPAVPRRTPEPAAVGATGVAGSLPSRAPSEATEPGPAPVSADLDRVAARAEMHQSALSELRGLYAPSFAGSAPPAGAGERPVADPGPLRRRTPKSAPTDAGPPPPPPSRTRTADDVRGMLSGFRAGVERGRGGSADDATTTDSSDATDHPTG